MVKLASILSRLNPAKILVIGDMLLDTYTIGKARRISPEAPVAVVNVQKEHHLPGGAGNVILNLLSLGSSVVAIGRVGNDRAGQLFCEALRGEGVDPAMIIVQNNYQTPIKNRIIADNQQIVRVDHEQILPLDENLEQWIIDQLPVCFEGVKVIAISDYGKGFLTSTLLTSIIQLARKRGIPVITDPKGSEFGRYKGTTVIKPNLTEAYSAAKLPSHSPLDHVATHVLEQTQAELLMVTRSEAGISLFDHHGKRFDFPVHAKAVKDVTGAGDTVLAMLAHAVANNLTYEEGAQLCNVAAGIAIEQVGCARVTLSDLAHRLFETDMRQKVFNNEHLFVLQEVLKREPFNLLIITQSKELSYSLYQAIKKLTEKEESLLIYMRDNQASESFIEMLASLREVNFIMTHSHHLKDLWKNVNPVCSYLYEMEGEKLSQLDTSITDKNLSSHSNSPEFKFF